MRAGRSQGGNRWLCGAPAVYLFCERSPAVADDGAGDGLEKKAVFLCYLVGGVTKMPPGLSRRLASAPAATSPMI